MELFQVLPLCGWILAKKVIFEFDIISSKVLYTPCVIFCSVSEEQIFSIIMFFELCKGFFKIIHLLFREFF